MSQAGRLFSSSLVAVWLGLSAAQAKTIEIDIFSNHFPDAFASTPQVFGTIFTTDTLHFYNDTPVIELACSFFSQTGGGACGGQQGFSASYTGLPEGRYNLIIDIIPFKPQHNTFSSGNYFVVLPDPVPGPIVGAGLPGTIAICGTVLWWRLRHRTRTA